MLPYRTIALLLSSSLSAGCMVGPDYKQPNAPLAHHYISSAGLAATPGARADKLDNWWDGFGDPLLSTLVTEAIGQNLELAQAQARVVQARATLGSATAALVPSASVNGQAARSRQSIETPLGQVLNSTPGYDRYGSSYELNLDASWEIDLFGGLRRNREAAMAQYQAYEAGAVATRLAIAAQTADIYVTVRGLQARLAIAQAQARTQRELLGKVKLLNQKGLAQTMRFAKPKASSRKLTQQSRACEQTLMLHSMPWTLCLAAVQAPIELKWQHPRTFRRPLSYLTSASRPNCCAAGLI